MISQLSFNRAPLTPNQYTQLPLTAIKPKGWLKKALDKACDGLTGNLFDFWEDTSLNCGWLGGSGDAWERAPYYLDGLLPLAYLLDDQRLKAIANSFIEWSLSSQREDGFFGPERNDDWWPRMIMLKVMIQYYEATSDKRVPLFMLKYCRYAMLNLPERKLADWAAARGGEFMLSVIWLYNLTGTPFLLELCKLISVQTYDWTGHLHSFPFTRPLSQTMPWSDYKKNIKSDEKGFWQRQYHLSHVVNVAMGLKTPAVRGQISGSQKDIDAFWQGWEKIMKTHGVAYGMFTGDEHLNGNSPTQGTELCAVVEMMFTLETLMQIDGDPKYADILEKLAFNALPAALTHDQRGHQYLQQANQVLASVAPRRWYNNGDDSNIFGLEPHFGCCTANMHQGFPKFCESLWMATADDGLAVMSYAPCTVRWKIGSTKVKFTVSGNYPADNTVTITNEGKKPCKFPIYFRIPSWSDSARVKIGPETFGAEAGTMLKINRVWQPGEEITVSLPAEITISKWYHQSAAVERGPLVYSLPIGEDWRKISDHDFAPDWEVHPTTAWNYALRPGKGFEAGIHNGLPHIYAYASRVDSWGMDGNSCADPPIRPEASAKIERIKLLPYYYPKLRITQFPIIEE